MKAFKIQLGLVIFVLFMFVMILMSMGGDDNSSSFSGGEDVLAYTGEYTEGLPMFDEIEGRENVPTEIARLAVGVAVKYRLLPSVVISQWAYESEWGRSYVAENDLNYFGITWFQGSPFPKGSARGIGGSEGGNYMKFPTTEESFNYYGYMLASQNNFNASVGNHNPDEVLLILGRGGYAAAGITESSPYFTGAMGIIESNKLTEYDEFAIERWGSTGQRGGNDEPIKNNGSYILPVKNPVLSSPFGGRDGPMGGGFEFHRGLDFAHPTGTPIMAIADGKVLISGMHYSWGNYIVIQHADGRCSLYAHQSQRIAQVGDTVKQGDTIGLIGSTGDSTGAHLHLEIAKSSDLSQGNLIDPATVLPK